MMLDARLGIGAHSYLLAFATAYQTDPPSIWLRLDGRSETVAALRHLVRHEMAHLRLEMAGLPSGPLQEALCDAFADGGMPAIAAGLGVARLAGPAPVRALAPSNADHVVIIDGTANMFKIAFTGTLSTAAFTGPGSRSATVTLATGVDYVPAGHVWLMSTLNYHTPYYVILDATGVVWYHFESGIAAIGGGQTTVTVTTTATTPAGTPAMGQYYYRYYVLKEAAF